MTDTEERNLVAKFRSDAPEDDYVWAGDPRARDAFLMGNILFDVTPGAARLTDLFRKHPELEQLALKTKAGWWGRAHKGALVTAHKHTYSAMRANELLRAGLLDAGG